MCFPTSVPSILLDLLSPWRFLNSGQAIPTVFPPLTSAPELTQLPFFWACFRSYSLQGPQNCPSRSAVSFPLLNSQKPVPLLGTLTMQIPPESHWKVVVLAYPPLYFSS